MQNNNERICIEEKIVILIYTVMFIISERKGDSNYSVVLIYISSAILIFTFVQNFL
jgi:hypothetical protein